MRRKLVGADHFANYVNLGGMKKNNEQSLFTKNRTCGETYQTDLWIFDTKTKIPKQLTEHVEIGVYHWETEKTVLFTAVQKKDRKSVV